MEDRYIRGQRKRQLVNIKAATTIPKEALLDKVMEIWGPAAELTLPCLFGYHIVTNPNLSP